MSDAVALALSMIAQEEARRDKLVADIRDAVAAVYITGGDTDFLVRRSEVHRLVAERMGWRAMDGNRVHLINAIVQGMGTVATAIGNRPVFLAMRKRDVEAPEARRESRLLRKLWRATKPSAKKRARALTADELAKWQERLEREGLGEVSAIPRGTRSRHRGMPPVQADIYATANARVTDLLAVAKLEVAVLELRAQGLALRPIAIKLGIDKMEVSAILKRVEARQTSGPGCE